MTPQEQRIAIAKACGWEFDPHHSRNEMYYVPSEDFLVGNPLHDLNAMHEAEKTLNPIKGIELCWHLNDMGISGEWEILTATAAQRAEAFLRTIGKWTTNPNEL